MADSTPERIVFLLAALAGIAGLYVGWEQLQLSRKQTVSLPKQEIPQSVKTVPQGLIQNQPAFASTLDDQAKVVNQFYDALGRADGTTASSLVIPEKRGTRSYAPDNIHQTYSVLLQPLRLDSVRSLPNDKVEAHYDYIGPSGKVCNDTAIVDMAFRDGSWMIAKIVPKGWC